MSGALATRAARLRENFDASFAAPLRDSTPDEEGFLAIRVEGAAYAIRLADISALSATPKITEIPGQPAALLGLAGFRGIMLPVYALAVLLGTSASLPPRWLVRTPHAAFAFSQLDGLMRQSAAHILPQQADSPARRHVSFFLQTEAQIRPVLDLASLLEEMRVLAGATMPAQP